MNKFKLLTIIVISAMLGANVAKAELNLNNMPEEELARALASVLKKNPKIAYDAVVEFGKLKNANKD